MSEVETIVLREIAGHRELKAIERGVIWERDDGETRLFFSPTSQVADDFELHSIAHIQTLFGDRAGNWNINDIARLNKRACFGHFSCENGRLRLNASFSIYKKEPAATWVASVLLRALGEQLALGFGIAQSYTHPQTLPGNRSNLEYPRFWLSRQADDVFANTAAIFMNRGLVSTAVDRTTVLEVPLDGGSPSRMLDKNAETALLNVSGTVQHPLAGCGYAATIALPYDPDPSLVHPLCDKLNKLEENPQDFVPRLGAWGARSLDRELVYSFFWPTNQPNDTLVGTIMNWMVLRTQWLRDNYWEPGVGIKSAEVLNG